MEKKEFICDCNIIHQDAVKKALKNKPKEEELEKLSQIFKILGDPTRIKILWTLDNHEMCVCDIANVLNMTKSSISHQLATLRSSGIVKYRKSGKEVYYMLDDDHVKKLYEIGLKHIDHKIKGDENNE
jgi:ArsR family transcriptional regulator